MDHPGMSSLDMLGSPHSSNGGSNGDGNLIGPPMTPLPPGMSDHIAAAAAQVTAGFRSYGHTRGQPYDHSALIAAVGVKYAKLANFYKIKTLTPKLSKIALS
jgi:hypothetical protein